MKRTIEVVYDGEVLRPTEPLDLVLNTTYRVTIEGAGLADNGPAPAAGVFDDLLSLVQPMDLPPDFASQLHHYLHGQPKA